MFKCHVQIAPSYLTDLTKPYIPGREGVRSSAQQLLDEGPKTQKNYGDRAFSMCGPKLWNKLPLELRQKCSVESFKKGLKTHLFKEAYNIWTVLTYLKNVFYKYFRLLYVAFMYICILYSFMYACKILAPVLFHSCIAHWAVWNCALKEFIIIIIIIIRYVVKRGKTTRHRSVAMLLPPLVRMVRRHCQVIWQRLFIHRALRSQTPHPHG